MVLMFVSIHNYTTSTNHVLFFSRVLLMVNILDI